jgi:hydroxymethylpyrimidine kinase/phosphomethylpyrimidine kinase
MNGKSNRIVALTIAGLDPSGGAGAIADLRTFVAFSCFPTAALTSITFQNTTGVFGVSHQTAATVRGQVAAIVQDFAVAGVKTGMLPNSEIVTEVARLFRETRLPAPVVDPVMVSTTGHDLIDKEAFEALKRELLPLARIVTPNIPEAKRLAGISIVNETDMRRAAEIIQQLGAKAVLVKGGHLSLENKDAVDILLNEAGKFLEFREEFVEVGEIHGSGCTLSAAIAAGLANGMSLDEAVGEAKSFVTKAIWALRVGQRLGHGARPL